MSDEVESYSTPDITKVQGGSVATFFGAVVAAAAAGVDGRHLDFLIAGGALVTVALIISDAAIRRGRAATVSTAVSTPTEDDEQYG